jgi:hypothetical protein
MTLADLLPRLKDLGEARVIVKNDMAVCEFVAVLDGITLGNVSWNFNKDGKEFHLYKDVPKRVKLYFADHARFNRIARVEFLDADGNWRMMVSVTTPDVADPASSVARAMQALIDDYGAEPDVTPE